MNEFYQIRLQTRTLLKVPLEQYEKDFVFVVNGDIFKTSRIIAELLSPKICKIHQADPTFNEFTITTQQKGDFSSILKLVNFNSIKFQNKESDFVSEIFEILGIESINIMDLENESNLNIDNVFQRVRNHERFRIFSTKFLQYEIDFISEHFFEINERRVNDVMKINLSTLELILQNPKLKLKSEDQLLSFINALYQIDSKYSDLYEYVEFENVESLQISEFVKIYDFSDLTNEVWRKVTQRLVKSVLGDDENPLKKRYKKTQITLLYSENHPFEGILNFLSKDSSESFKITSSSVYNDDESYSPNNVILFKNDEKYFSSANTEDSWICFDFKSRRIVPSNYTLKSYPYYSNYSHPKSWVVEASLDGKKWEIIDEQTESSEINGKNKICMFKINVKKICRFVRLRQTDFNWAGHDYLRINSVEFYGNLM